MYGVRKCSSFSSFTDSWPVSPEPLVEETVFSPLCIFASFLKDKMVMRAWISLWTFYFVPLIYISVFVPVPYRVDKLGYSHNYMLEYH